MKKVRFLWLLLISCFLLAACGGESVADKNIVERIQKDKTIFWGVKMDTRLFGFYNIEKGKIEGYDIDVAEAITKHMLGDEGKSEFIEVTSKTRIPLLQNGNIDAIIATMTISEERKKVVDFSDVYFDAGQSLLVEKGSPVQSIHDLNEATPVLAIKGSTSAQRIREAAPTAPILEMENYAEGFQALQSGQGVALTTDNAILYGMAAENSNYEVVGGIFTDEPYGIATSKKQKEFHDKINEALRSLEADGTLSRLREKWNLPTKDGKEGA